MRSVDIWQSLKMKRKNHLYKVFPLEILVGLYQDLNDPNYSEPSGGWKWIDGTYANMNGFNPNSISLSIQGGTAI